MSIQLAINNIRTKSNNHYICSECGDTENIQAHHNIPHDDNSLITLCGKCHHKRHPNLSLGLFLNKTTQPYWINKSASSIAKIYKVHPRTIWRLAKKLLIPKGTLSIIDEERIHNHFKLALPLNKLMENTINLPKLTCQRCGYEWIPRKEEPPETCPNPKCHSPYWNKPRKSDNNGNNEGENGTK